MRPPGYETLDSYGAGARYETASRGGGRREAAAIDAQIRAEHPELFSDPEALALRQRQLQLLRLAG